MKLIISVLLLSHVSLYHYAGVAAKHQTVLNARTPTVSAVATTGSSNSVAVILLLVVCTTLCLIEVLDLLYYVMAPTSAPPSGSSGNLYGAAVAHEQHESTTPEDDFELINTSNNASDENINNTQARSLSLSLQLPVNTPPSNTPRISYCGSRVYGQGTAILISSTFGAFGKCGFAVYNRIYFSVYGRNSRNRFDPYELEDGADTYKPSSASTTALSKAKNRKLAVHTV